MTFKIACIYIRCSTEEQEKKGYSLEYQEEQCQNYIQSKEMAYFKTYRDPGVSGTTPLKKRDGMLRMFEDIKKNKFNVVVFHAFDRLARDMVVAYNIIGKFQENGITVCETQHDIDTTTPDGKTRMAMYFTFGQMEHSAILERSRLGRKARKDRIGFTGGPIPFGYTKPDDEKDGIPIIDPEQSEIVRLIYNMYWKDGYKISKIPILLDSQNIDPGKYNNKGWNVPKVTRILKNHKIKYEGGLINNNIHGICWPRILETEYPEYPRPKTEKK
jgi:DNA invertase Pin-like site-specific DNA recombinase